MQTRQDEQTLIPPLSAIHERLGQLAREQRRLRTLFRLAIQEREERERFGGHPATAGETARAATASK